MGLGVGFGDAVGVFTGMADDAAVENAGDGGAARVSRFAPAVR